MKARAKAVLWNSSGSAGWQSRPGGVSRKEKTALPRGIPRGSIPLAREGDQIRNSGLAYFTFTEIALDLAPAFLGKVTVRIPSL